MDVVPFRIDDGEYSDGFNDCSKKVIDRLKAMKGAKMSKYKELNERPKALINGEDYVPRELFKEYLIEKLEDEKLDCDNQDEKDGIDYAIKCIWNS